MALRKLVAVAPAIALLTLAAPVAGAGADPSPAAQTPQSLIPCYPVPMDCGPGGKAYATPFAAAIGFDFAPAMGAGFGLGPAPLAG